MVSHVSGRIKAQKVEFDQSASELKGHHQVNMDFEKYK